MLMIRCSWAIWKQICRKIIFPNPGRTYSIHCVAQMERHWVLNVISKRKSLSWSISSWSRTNIFVDVSPNPASDMCCIIFGIRFTLYKTQVRPLHSEFNNFSNINFPYEAWYYRMPSKFILKAHFCCYEYHRIVDIGTSRNQNTDHYSPDWVLSGS